MENASRALLMAGSVLIAIIIIAVLAKTGGVISSFQKTKLSEEEQAQIVAYNEQFTKYLNQYVYGTEIITLCNKAVDGIKTGFKISYFTIKVDFKDTYAYNIEVRNESTGKIEEKTMSTTKLEFNYDSEGKMTFFNTTGDTSSFRNRAFKCNKIEFDDDGIVSSISFQEIEFY